MFFGSPRSALREESHRRGTLTTCESQGNCHGAHLLNPLELPVRVVERSPIASKERTPELGQPLLDQEQDHNFASSR